MITKIANSVKQLFGACRRCGIMKYPLLGLGVVTLLSGCGLHLGMLNPKGVVAVQERKLFFDSLALMLIVVIPVIIMSFAFVIRYRASHKTADYKPNWSHNVFLEAIWWTVPCIIIVILGVMTWHMSHKLDPYRKLDVGGKPIVVQAVALRWKWLFIYPEQHIATVNYLEIPKDRQVEFWITADAPMSALFIPQLGSQIYAMAGMRTRLHLIGNHIGTYEGMDTQYNGDGFSEMRFKAHVVSPATYNLWLHTMRLRSKPLELAQYKKLVVPSIGNKPEYFSRVYPHLFKRIMQQYTQPNMRLH